MEAEEAPEARSGGAAEAELPALEPAESEGAEDDNEGNP